MLPTRDLDGQLGAHTSAEPPAAPPTWGRPCGSRHRAFNARTRCPGEARERQLNRGIGGPPQARTLRTRHPQAPPPPRLRPRGPCWPRPSVSLRALSQGHPLPGPGALGLQKRRRGPIPPANPLHGPPTATGSAEPPARSNPHSPCSDGVRPPPHPISSVSRRTLSQPHASLCSRHGCHFKFTC